MDIMTVKDAAALLSISARRVRALIKAGKIEAVNIGGAGRGARWLPLRTSVEAWAQLPRNPGGRPKQS